MAIVVAVGIAGVASAWHWRDTWRDDGTTAPLEKQAATPKAQSNAAASPRPSIERGPIHFTDVRERSGIDFVHVSGDSPEKPFPAANGSGVAGFDLDLDGQIDLYFLTGTQFPLDESGAAPINRCYRSRGEWQFEEATAPTGLGHNGYSAGVAVGDFDNDGFPDVFVNCFGPDRLFRNQGDGTFADVTAMAGVDDPHWGTSAAFVDFDGDGALDLYVCNYADWSLETNPWCGDRARGVRTFCLPSLVEPAPHALFHNEGDGRFRSCIEETGLKTPVARGQGVIAGDFNGDGLVDLYVANDLHPNFLFLGVGGGRFIDASESSGTSHDYQGRTLAGMGIAAADANRDGLLDLFVTNFENEHNTFYENLGNNQFQEVSFQRGLAAKSLPWVGWGTALADLDLDGWPDVIVTNGHVDNLLQGRDATYSQPPGLWQNRGGRFDWAGGARAGDYFATRHAGRGLAVADLDNDGDLDVVIVHQDGPPALLRNERISAGSPPASRMRVRVVGRQASRDSVGAVIRFIADGRTFMHPILGGGSYQSAHDLRQLMWLPAEPRATCIEIAWPKSGSTATVLTATVEPGGSYRFVEPEATLPAVMGIDADDGAIQLGRRQ